MLLGGWFLIVIYPAGQKFGIIKIFVMFLKEVSTAHRGYIYLIKILKYYYNLK